MPLLCVSEVRGEGGLMGSGFEHVLVSIRSGFFEVEKERLI